MSTIEKIGMSGFFLLLLAMSYATGWIRGKHDSLPWLRRPSTNDDIDRRARRTFSNN